MNTENIKSAVIKAFEKSDDFALRDICGGRYTVMYIKNLSSRTMIARNIITPLTLVGGDIRDAVTNASATEIGDAETAISDILNGAAIVMGGTPCRVFSVMTNNEEGRSQDEPQTENVIRGAHDGFTENGDTNAMLIRRRIRSEHLKKEVFRIGNVTKTSVGMMYLDNVADAGIVNEVRRRLQNIRINGVIDSGYVEMYIQDGDHPVYPTVGNSERPDKIAAKLLEGRVAIIVDGSPVVLTVPYLFCEGFQITEDYAKSVWFGSFERIMRFFASLISVYLPGLYTAVVVFHPYVLDPVLVDSIESSRDGIGAPLMWEVITALLIFEVLREVGLRMPKAVGSAVGIVGSLILGDSAVEAGIITYPTLIVVAFAAVCNFIAPPYMNSNTVHRFAVMIVSGFFGLFGFFAALIVGSGMMCAKQSFGVPYLSPFAPIYPQGQKDFLLMSGIWDMKYIPTSIVGKKIARADGKQSYTDV